MRHLTSGELFIVNIMLENGQSNLSKKPQLNGMLVEEMEDNGMGSLLFISNEDNNQRKLGALISEAEFTDADGTSVSIVLNADNNGCLYELDVFKGNFLPIVKWPASIDSLRFCNKRKSK